jgi:hypothetical protein
VSARDPDSKPASALRVAEHYPAVAPVIEREFKRICPMLELLDFNSDGNRWSWILFSGAETEILRLGVIDSSMIAVRPKRAWWSRRRIDAATCQRSSESASRSR